MYKLVLYEYKIHYNNTSTLGVKKYKNNIQGEGFYSKNISKLYQSNDYSEHKFTDPLNEPNRYTVLSVYEFETEQELNEHIVNTYAEELL